MISEKIIKTQRVLNYKDILVNVSEADVEDLFSESDYLALFNGAFEEYGDITTKDLANSSKNRMVEKINEHLKIKRFNHYRPANYLAKEIGSSLTLSTETIDHFQSIIEIVNKAMKTRS